MVQGSSKCPRTENGSSREGTFPLTLRHVRALRSRTTKSSRRSVPSNAPSGARHSPPVARKPNGRPRGGRRVSRPPAPRTGVNEVPSGGPQGYLHLDTALRVFCDTHRRTVSRTHPQVPGGAGAMTTAKLRSVNGAWTPDHICADCLGDLTPGYDKVFICPKCTNTLEEITNLRLREHRPSPPPWERHPIPFRMLNPPALPECPNFDLPLTALITFLPPGGYVVVQKDAIEFVNQ